MALAVGIAIALFAIDHGSVSSVQHTVASKSVPLTDGPPLATLKKVGTYGGDTTLIDGVLVTPTTHGATGYDPASGKRIWTYQRSDIPICARGSSGTRAILMYRSGGQCSEAIALDARTGVRGWQRTIESEGPNAIAFGDNSFVSIGANKIIAYEEVSGFERFHLYANTAVDGQSSAQSCQFLQASAGRIVPVLQRCKSTADGTWITKLLTYDAVSGNPRELSQSVIGYRNPTLVASLSSGSALIGTNDQLLLAGSGRSNPTPVPSITVPAGTTPTFLSSATIDLLVVGSTAYRFSGPTVNIAWKTTVDCLPSVSNGQVNILSGGVFTLRNPQSGEPTATSTLPQLPDLTDATVTSAGKFVVISTPKQATVYS
ncbi:MAG: hypothetical protein ABI137_13265 [Antricoccus sp.]